MQEILGVIVRKTIPALGAGVPESSGGRRAGSGSEADAILWNTDGCFRSEGWMDEPRNITAAQMKSCQMSADSRERKEHDSGVKLSTGKTRGLHSWRWSGPTVRSPEHGRGGSVQGDDTSQWGIAF